MPEIDIALLQANLLKMERQDIDYADLFYKNLFLISPKSQTLFKGSIKEQKRKLQLSLAHVIKELEHFDELKETLFHLGKRHVDYGVELEDFPDVTKALLRTFKQLDPNFTTEMENNWKKALELIIVEMKRAWS